MPRGNPKKAPAATNSANEHTTQMGELGMLRAVHQAMVNASTPYTRHQLAGMMGYQYQGDRDLFTACGYTKSLTPAHYWAQYLRHPIAKAVVNRPVEGCWRSLPEVSETDLKSDETQFEKAWKDITLDKELKVWEKLQRADMVSGVGRYGVLFLGFDDSEDMALPVQRASKLLYLYPYSELNATIGGWETDRKNSRYGKPLIYSLTFTDGANNRITGNVHHSRVIHIAEGAMENDIYGTPRLEVAFNQCDDIAKLAGCGAEAFWQAAFPGLHFDIKDDYSPSQADLDAFKTNIEDYVHRMTRYLRTQGVDVKTLSSQIADPSGIINAAVGLISAGTGIPQRILLGSERGELASSQDAVQWASLCETRRTSHVGPNVVEPFIQKLIEVGILPKPKGESFTLTWPSLHEPTDKEKADVAKVRTETIAAYVGAPEAGSVIPLDFFRRQYLQITDEQLEEIKSLEEEEGQKIEVEQAEIEEPVEPLEKEEEDTPPEPEEE